MKALSRVMPVAAPSPIRLICCEASYGEVIDDLAVMGAGGGLAVDTPVPGKPRSPREVPVELPLLVCMTT
jgi:hypothetical protein